MYSTLGRYVPGLAFDHPCALLITGTTGAGKSYFTKCCVEKGGIEGPINKIYYFMPRIEPVDITPADGQELFIMEGMPTRDWLDKTFPTSNSNALLIIDDQWTDCVDSKVVLYLTNFARRHLSLSMIFIGQNFYEKSKIAISIR